MMLHMMLNVMDEEVLLVIHLETMRAFRVEISGIAENFQLQGLLANALVEKGIKAKSFSKKVLEVLE